MCAYGQPIALAFVRQVAGSSREGWGEGETPTGVLAGRLAGWLNRFPTSAVRVRARALWVFCSDVLTSLKGPALLRRHPDGTRCCLHKDSSGAGRRRTGSESALSWCDVGAD